jgi:hypothetical protein
VPCVGQLVSYRVGVSLDDLLLRVVRGEEDPALLAEIGVNLEGEPGSYRVACPAGLPVVVVAMVDLAAGFLHHWSLGTSLPEWSAYVLSADCFDFPEDRSDADDLLIGAMWDASFGEPVSGEAVDVARHLRDQAS